MLQQNEWVYNAIVKASNDPSELIAYALYKAEKAELADKLKATNVSAERIASELRNFHDQAVRSEKRIQGYKSQAGLILTELVDNLQQELKGELINTFSDLQRRTENTHRSSVEAQRLRHKTEIEKLTKLLSSAKKDAVSEYKRKIDQQSGNDSGRLSKFLGWLWSGMSGIAATIVTFVIIYGLAAILVSSETRNVILKEALTRLVSTVAPDPMIPTIKSSSNTIPPLNSYQPNDENNKSIIDNSLNFSLHSK